jgi:hypothetical protein
MTMHEEMHQKASPDRLLDAVVIDGYQSFMFGLAWILLGSAVALTGGCRESPWLPDRAVRSCLHRAGLGDRFHRLLGNQHLRNPG